MQKEIQFTKPESLGTGEKMYVYHKDQITEYMGNMFGSPIPVGRIGYGKLYSDNTPKTLSLTAGEVTRVGGYQFAPNSCGVTGNSTTLTSQFSGFGLVYGFISFIGGSNIIYDLHLRKNGEDICVCNPQTQAIGNSEFELSGMDFTPISEGDEIELWFQSDTNKILTYSTTKLILLIL